MLKKNPIPINTATPRQAIICTFWGFVAGIYCFQPFLSLTARDRKSMIGHFVEVDQTKDTVKNLESKDQS